MTLENIADEAIGVVVAADKAKVLGIAHALHATRHVAQLLVQKHLLAVRTYQPQVQTSDLWDSKKRIDYTFVSEENFIFILSGAAFHSRRILIEKYASSSVRYRIALWVIEKFTTS